MNITVGTWKRSSQMQTLGFTRGEEIEAGLVLRPGSLQSLSSCLSLRSGPPMSIAFLTLPTASQPTRPSPLILTLSSSSSTLQALAQMSAPLVVLFNRPLCYSGSDSNDIHHTLNSRKTLQQHSFRRHTSGGFLLPPSNPANVLVQEALKVMSLGAGMGCPGSDNLVTT